jgi:hypothetical protein
VKIPNVVIGEIDLSVLDGDVGGEQRHLRGVAVVAVARTAVEDGAVFRTDDAAVAGHDADILAVESLLFVRAVVDSRLHRRAVLVLAGSQKHFDVLAVAVSNRERKLLLAHVHDAREPIAHMATLCGRALEYFVGPMTAVFRCALADCPQTGCEHV